MIRKGLIAGKIVDVINFDEFSDHPNMYQPGYTAIDGGNGLIYPLRTKTDSRPGAYISSGGLICRYKEPAEEERSNYSADNITDFSKPKDIADLINKQQSLKSQERTILTTADNIFNPQVKDSDYPEMVALKNAVNMKHIDLDSYEHRFGKNYNNDRRLFEKPNISLLKLTSVCNALDIKATLTLEDANSDVPNPMGKSVSVELTSGGGEDNA